MWLNTLVVTHLVSKTKIGAKENVVNDIVTLQTNNMCLQTTM